MRVTVETSPSLALVKYWGKSEKGINIAATSSLAVSLGDLRTTTTLKDGVEADRVTVNGSEQPLERCAPLLDEFRRRTGNRAPVEIESHNSFPTSAGIASSSSGFAAVALGLDSLFGSDLPRAEISEVARFGSGSACRAVYGGFTSWRAGAEHAEMLYGADHWPDLQIVVGVVESGSKATSSRDGMSRVRETSPYYRDWVNLSGPLFASGCEALAGRDIEALGIAMRRSYLSMFATMLAATPPLLYWRPESLWLITLCESLRADGIGVWETMDAGPQVKMITTSRFVDQVCEAIELANPDIQIIETQPGGEPIIGSPED